MKDAVFSSILTVNFSLSNEKAGRAKGSPTGSSPTGSCNGVYAVTLQEKRARSILLYGKARFVGYQ